MIELFNDLWSLLDTLSYKDSMLTGNSPATTTNVGIRKFLSRAVPHNLYLNKDSEGNPESYKVSIVYTPFKKSDIEVKIDDGNLVVNVGNKTKVEEKPEEKSDEDKPEGKVEKVEKEVYRGISEQSYYFKFPLAGVDEEKVTAKAEDGILTITLPFEKVEKPEPKRITLD